eukprot:11210714-Lingulodinium_polyedra.AAC.1
MSPSTFRRDLVLPRDRLEQQGDAFLRMVRSKTWETFGVQHGRCSDPTVVALFDRAFGHLEPWGPFALFSAPHLQAALEQ